MKFFQKRAEMVLNVEVVELVLESFSEGVSHNMKDQVPRKSKAWAFLRTCGNMNDSVKK